MKSWPWLVGGALVVLLVVTVRDDRPGGGRKAAHVAEVAAAGADKTSRTTSAPATQVSGREQVRVAPAPVPSVAPFRFVALTMNTRGDNPEACFAFNKPLAGGEGVHLGDHIAIEPAARPALRVTAETVCLGGLDFARSYTVTLRGSLPAASGERLGQDRALTLEIADKPPQVDISGDGFILPRATAHGLTVTTVNIRRLRVHVLRMNEALFTARKRDDGGYSEGLGFNDNGINGYRLRRLLAKSVSVVWSGTMEVLENHNRTVETAFPLAGVIRPGETGAFLVTAQDDAKALPERVFTHPGGSDDDNYGYGYDAWEGLAAHWVISTDMALTSFTGTDGLLVSVRTFSSARPVAGARVSLIAAGQDRLGEAVTDAGGVARFAPGLLRGRGAQQAAFLWAYGADGDFAFMDLGRPAFDFSDRGVTGRPSPAPLQAFLTTDRGIYRPGHTVHAVALLRDRLGNGVGGPLSLVLRRPDGVEFKRYTVTGEAAGGSAQDIALPRSAPRGTWTLEAKTDPEAAPIGRTGFSVEDYVPQQLRVALGRLPASVATGATLPIVLQGDFLYGAPAVGLHASAELRVTADPDPVPGAPGFQFGLVDERVEDKATEVTLPDAGADGVSRGAVKVEAPAGLHAPLKLIVAAGLAEPSGRVVTDKGEVRLKTREVLIGIRPRFSGGLSGEGTEAAFDIGTFDADGKQIARSGLRARLIYQETLFDWFEDRGWHWHAHTVDRVVATAALDTDGARFTRYARKLDWGRYVLVVEDPASGAASSVRFVSGWDPGSEQADLPDKLTVAAEPGGIAPGGMARLRVSGPFAGRAQLVIANDRVLETREVEVPKEGATIEVRHGPDWGAGVYAMVTLYRPLSEATAHAPVRAVGLTWIGTEARGHTLGVGIEAPARMRPDGELTATLRLSNIPAGDTAYVALAAVDEGILQLTRFQNPDPVGFLFGKRALGVAMRDDYGKLLDGSADAGRITGGDEGLGGTGLPVVSARLVAFHSGILRLRPDGTAVARFPIPDFLGAVRLMAVAWSEHAVGQAASATLVRDAVAADVAMPRFLGTGDTARLAVQIHNVEGNAGRYTLRVTASGAVALTEDGVFARDVKPGERAAGRVGVRAVADGVGTIAADLSGPNVSVHRSWQLSVRAPHLPRTEISAAWQQPGERFTIPGAVGGAFVAGSMKVTLGYGGVPNLDAAALIGSLSAYPYGCTEQMVSTALPLLYERDAALAVTARTPADLRDRVQNAIDTILLRQTEDGEFGLWRAADYRGSVWLTLYAVDFLMRARELGYDVPQAAIARSLDYAERAARGSVEEHAFPAYTSSASTTRAYAQYILARTGRADLSALRLAHDQGSRESPVNGQPGGRFWAENNNDASSPVALGYRAAALALMGDRSRAAIGFARAEENLGTVEWDARWFDMLFSTRLRDTAMLTALAAEAGMTEQVAAFTRRLAAERPELTTLTTQEQAALLAAAHALGTSGGKPAVSVNGHAAPGGGVALAPTAAEIADGYTVENVGKGALWRTLSVTGAPLTADQPIDGHGLTLERRYFDISGKPVDPASLRQNDRVIVLLTGRAVDGVAHRAVVVDPLPAGLEIETALGTTSSYKFLGSISPARVREARDDRFVAAVDLGQALRYRPWSEDGGPNAEDPRSFRLAYVARAVTPGHFTLPEAGVEDMYRPDVLARTAAGQMDVAPR